MLRLSAFHAVAAQRGDGLRPELLRLLEQKRADAEARLAATEATINRDGEVLKVSADVVPSSADE